MAVHPSQEDEERLVREFFDGETTGFFVEVGVNGTAAGLSTRHLEQSGWAGVLVQPQPDLAAFLVTERKAKVFAVACTAPERAGEAVALHVDAAQAGLDPQPMGAGAQAAYTVIVPTRTLDSLLKEAEAPVPIDLLSLSVEGHQVEVLRGFDFAHWQPMLVLLEDHIGNLRTHRFMKSKGYRLIRRLGSNGWYVPADMSVRPSAEERREVLRTYYLALPFRKLRNLWRRIRGK